MFGTLPMAVHVASLKIDWKSLLNASTTSARIEPMGLEHLSKLMSTLTFGLQSDLGRLIEGTPCWSASMVRKAVAVDDEEVTERRQVAEGLGQTSDRK